MQSSLWKRTVNFGQYKITFKIERKVPGFHTPNPYSLQQRNKSPIPFKERRRQTNHRYYLRNKELRKKQKLIIRSC
jgi:hypothetical protein